MHYGVRQVIKKKITSGKLPSNSDFLNSSTTDVLGWTIPCCGCYPVNYRMLNSVPVSTHYLPAALLNVTKTSLDTAFPYLEKLKNTICLCEYMHVYLFM